MAQHSLAVLGIATSLGLQERYVREWLAETGHTVSDITKAICDRRGAKLGVIAAMLSAPGSSEYALVFNTK